MHSTTVRAVFCVTIISLLLFAIPVMADQGTGLTFQMADNNTAVLKKKEPTEKQPVAEQQKNNTQKPTSRQAHIEKHLEDITVTAQKREESVHEVPISMTVFDEIAIEDSKIESVQDIAPYTSNFALIDKSSGVFSPVIRGVSNTFSKISQPISIIIDGIPISNAQGFNEALMDIERIEVLTHFFDSDVGFIMISGSYDL